MSPDRQGSSRRVHGHQAASRLSGSRRHRRRPVPPHRRPQVQYRGHGSGPRGRSGPCLRGGGRPAARSRAHGPARGSREHPGPAHLAPHRHPAPGRTGQAAARGSGQHCRRSRGRGRGRTRHDHQRRRLPDPEPGPGQRTRHGRARTEPRGFGHSGQPRRKRKRGRKAHPGHAFGTLSVFRHLPPHPRRPGAHHRGGGDRQGHAGDPHAGPQHLRARPDQLFGHRRPEPKHQQPHRLRPAHRRHGLHRLHSRRFRHWQGTLRPGHAHGKRTVRPLCAHQLRSPCPNNCWKASSSATWAEPSPAA